MRRFRPRFTILTLMIVVVIASLVLTGILVHRQRIRLNFALRSAAADYENAKLTHEVAEIAVLEYKDGIYKQDLATFQNELALAESDLERARNSPAADQQEELCVQRAKDGLTLAEQLRFETLKEFLSGVQKAKAEELAKKAALDQLKAAVARQWW